MFVQIDNKWLNTFSSVVWLGLKGVPSLSLNEYSYLFVAFLALTKFSFFFLPLCTISTRPFVILGCKHLMRCHRRRRSPFTPIFLLRSSLILHVALIFFGLRQFHWMWTLSILWWQFSTSAHSLLGYFWSVRAFIATLLQIPIIHHFFRCLWLLIKKCVLLKNKIGRRTLFDNDSEK